MPMKIGIPKEIHPGERRVAATPETARWLKKLGFSVAIETEAGAMARAEELPPPLLPLDHTAEVGAER